MTSVSAVERERIRPLAHVDTKRRRAPHELMGHPGRVRDPVLAADRRSEHVVDTEAGDERGIDALDRNAERCLELAPLLELDEPALGGGEEEVPDLLEERSAELTEEPDARLREPHLRLGRELLPDPTHRLAGRAARDLPHLREHDAVRAPEGEVVGDGRSDRARARYDDSSHPRSSWRSPSLSCRSGRRTSSRSGTPRRPRMNLSAAWRGKRSITARSSPSATAPASCRLSHDGRDLVRERGREAGDRADGARGDTVEDERLGADEDVEALEQIRARSARRVRRRP